MYKKLENKSLKHKWQYNKTKLQIHMTVLQYYIQFIKT